MRKNKRTKKSTAKTEAAVAVRSGDLLCRCRTCKHWKQKEDWEQWQDDEDGKEHPFEVKSCEQPKMVKFVRPETDDGLALMDGSYYRARMFTAENFGCVNHEAA